MRSLSINDVLIEMSSGHTTRTSIHGRLNKADVLALTQGLERAPHITEICFANNQLTPEEIQQFYPFFSRMKAVEISTNHLSSETFAAFMQACAKAKTLHTLVLIDCDLDDDKLATLGDFLKAPGCALQALDIRNNNQITRTGLESLDSALRNNFSLITLDRFFSYERDVETSLSAQLERNKFLSSTGKGPQHFQPSAVATPPVAPSRHSSLLGDELAEGQTVHAVEAIRARL